MVEENPGGVPEKVVVGDHGETDEDAGREADIEGEDVDVVCGGPALAISGLESKFFLFFLVLGKWLERQILSQSVVDTARPPQCEFSNLQNLPITFYLEFPVGWS